MTATLVAERLDSMSDNHAISTRTGKAFSIFDEETWEFDLDDIVPALANITRFNGQTDFYSVAEHSVRVATHMRREEIPTLGLSDRDSVAAEIAALMHDATEAYMGDLARPQKHRTGLQMISTGGEYSDFSVIESMMNDAIMDWIGVLPGMSEQTWNSVWAAVKRSDYATYLKERSERPRPAIGPSALSPAQAEDVFRAYLHSLIRKLT